MIGLNIWPCKVITIGMTYVVAVMVASGIFIAAGRRNKQVSALASAPGTDRFPADPLWDQPEIDLSAPHPPADVGAAMRVALKRLLPILRNRAVQAEIALSPGLMVPMQGAAVTDLLEDLLSNAIQSAPASRMLVTAGRQNGGVYVGITDDMPAADLTVRTDCVRGLKQRAAMLGGTLQVDVRPREGATVTLWLPAVG